MDRNLTLSIPSISKLPGPGLSEKILLLLSVKEIRVDLGILIMGADFFVFNTGVSYWPGPGTFADGLSIRNLGRQE